MSSPDPYYGSTIPLGLGGGGGDEWRNFLQRRAELIEQGMRRLGMAQQINQITGLPAQQSFEAASYADAEQLASQRMQAPVMDEPRWRRLIGAAQFYGIENPEQYEPQLLEQVVEAARGDLNQSNIAQDLTASERLRLKIVNVLSSVSIFGNPEFTSGVLASLRDLPFAGDALAKTAWYNEANRQAGLISEVVYSNGFIDPPIAPRGLVNFAGENAIAAVVGTYLGGTGWAGGLTNPLIRGGALGAATGLLTETGGEESNQQKAIKIAEMTAFGGAFDLGLSILSSRLAASFPRQGRPIDPEWQQTGWRPGDVPEAQWSVIRGQIEAGPGGPQVGGFAPEPGAPMPPGVAGLIPEQGMAPPMFEAPPGVYQVRPNPSGSFLLRGEPERIIVRALGPGQASADATALTKQATVLESPLAADLAAMPRIDEAEVALAALARAPGQISVIRDVGDTGKVVRKFLQEYLSNGVGPQDFRVVARRVATAEQISLREPPTTGTVKVYHGTNIEGEESVVPGAWVTPSRALATTYAGRTGRILEFEAPADHFAWMGEVEAVYAPPGYNAAQAMYGSTHIMPMGTFGESRNIPFQHDILVSDGAPISNKLVKQYESFGMFSGQQVTISRGIQATLVEPGAEVSRVRSLTGEESLVPTRELAPGRSSFVSDIAPEAYQRMKAYAQGQMVDEATRAGLPPALTDWFSEELASQLPRYVEEFLDAAGIEGQAARGAYKALFTELRIREFKTLAPEEFAQVEALSVEVGAVQLPAVMEGRPVWLEEVAEAKGMRWVPADTIVRPATRVSSLLLQDWVPQYRGTGIYTGYIHAEALEEAASELSSLAGVSYEIMLADLQHNPALLDEGYVTGSDEFLTREGAEALIGAGETAAQGEAGVLIDIRSGESIPFSSQSAALEFLQNLDREVPDYSPESVAPFELATPLNGSNPGISTGPAHDGVRLREVVDRGERELARLERASAGGGGGGDEPPFVPPSGGAPALPPGGPGSEFDYLYNTDFGRYRRLETRLSNVLFRWFEPMNMFAQQMDRIMYAEGIQSSFWASAQRVMNAVERADAESIPWDREGSDILAMFRSAKKRNGTVARMAEFHPELRRSEMLRSGYSEREILAQERLAALYDQLGTEYGIKKILDYMPHIRRADSPEWAAQELLNFETSGTTEFFAEMMRHGAIDYREPNAELLLSKWIMGATRARHVWPELQAFRAEWVDNESVPKSLRRAAGDWATLLNVGHLPHQDNLPQSISSAFRAVGIPVSGGDVASIMALGANSTYRGLLGWRTYIALREMINPLMAWARTGNTVETSVATAKFAKSPRDRAEMRALGERGGWTQQRMTMGMGEELFRSPQDLAPGFAAAPSEFGPTAESARFGIRKGLDYLHDLTPEYFRGGLRGTAVDPLFMLQRVNETSRTVSGWAGYQTFMKATRAYDEAVLADPLAEKTPLLGKLLKNSGVANYDHTVQREVARLVRGGQYEEAAFVFVNEHVNSMGRIGGADAPIGIQRAGVVGRMGAMLGNFTIHFQSHVRSAMLRSGLAPEFGGTSADRVRAGATFAARHALVLLALAKVKEESGWDISKWYWHGSLMWAGGPLVTGVFQSLQTISAHMKQAQGQYLTPVEEALLAESEMNGGPGMDLLRMMNPAQGAVRTYEGFTQGVGAADPYETTAQFLVTGRVQDASMIRMLNDPQSLNWTDQLVPQQTLKQAETTQLPAEQEAQFRHWAAVNRITDVDHPNSFYDYRGYWRDVASRGVDQTRMYSDGIHFPDTYKQHGHPTFSVESKYSKGPGDGGRWQGEQFIPPQVNPQELNWTGGSFPGVTPAPVPVSPLPAPLFPSGAGMAQ